MVASGVGKPPRTQEAAEVQARVNSEPTLSEQLLGKAVAEVPKEATKEEPEVPHEAEKAISWVEFVVLPREVNGDALLLVLIFGAPAVTSETSADVAKETVCGFVNLKYMKILK